MQEADAQKFLAKSPLNHIKIIDNRAALPETLPRYLSSTQQRLLL